MTRALSTLFAMALTMAMARMVPLCAQQAQSAMDPGAQDRPDITTPLPPKLPRAESVTRQPRRVGVTGWEIEGHGGFALAGMPTGGLSAVPIPGAALTTSSPLFPTRRTSSWFFGSGAALLNSV